MNILLSAYACEPGKGSEPGIGWGWVGEFAGREHQVWVITRKNNQRRIEGEVHLNKKIFSNIHFVYYDLPAWVLRLKKGKTGIFWYYYLWQIGIYFLASRMNKDVQFDCIHHVTFVKYCMPVFLSLLPIPFIWGPVGGGESAPVFGKLGFKGVCYEILRICVRNMFELDPFVRYTARKSLAAFGTTEETRDRLKKIGSKNTGMVSQVGLLEENLVQWDEKDVKSPVMFIYAGTLDRFKGVHLALEGLVACKEREWLFSIVGDGREKKRLIQLVEKFNIKERVRFFGWLTHDETREILKRHHVFVFPSLHDSGGMACLEAMSCGLPVVCLNTGGPAIIVSPQCGVMIEPDNAEQIIKDLSDSFTALIRNPETINKMGENAFNRVRDCFLWKKKYELIYPYVEKIINGDKYNCSE